MNDPTVKSIIETSTRWLFNEQDKSGGWAERHGTTANVLNTAEVIIALLDGGLINEAKVEAGDSRIQKAVSFIEEKQTTGDENAGAWQREVTVDGAPRKLPDPFRSSFALQALIKAGRPRDSEPVTKGMAWLLSIRNADNSWGYRKGSQSELLPTCCALLALLKACEPNSDKDKDPLKNAIEGGLKSLVENYQAISGSFNRSGDYFEGLHTVYAVLVLQGARHSGFGKYIREEKNALDWLLQHQDKASRAVEEIIKIDPIRDDKGYGKGDYGFFCNTDLPLLKVLSNSGEYSDSKLARNTMINIGNRRDESGGFFGHRVFTWSTAHAICGLNAAESKFPQIPVSTPEYVGIKVGTPILVFAIIVFAGTVYMSVMGSFKEIQAVVSVFLMLALLLANGFIGEKTFTELVKGFGISWPSLGDKKKQ
jgi:hypothetical protein